MSKKEIHPFLKSNRDIGISLGGLIEIYEWLGKCGKIKKGDAGYDRLNQLKLRYSKGERYMKNDKTE